METRSKRKVMPTHQPNNYNLQNPGEISKRPHRETYGQKQPLQQQTIWIHERMMNRTPVTNQT